MGPKQSRLLRKVCIMNEELFRAFLIRELLVFTMSRANSGKTCRMLDDETAMNTLYKCRNPWGIRCISL